MTSPSPRRSGNRFSLALASAMLLSSCSTPPAAPPPAPQASLPPPSPAPVSGRATPLEPANAAPIRQNGVAPVFSGTAPAGSAPVPAAALRSTDPAYKVADNGDVSLNYMDTDVREIVRLILGSILKVNYSIDPGFQGTVTIQTARPLKHDELISTLQGLLNQAGGQLSYQNGLYRVSAQGSSTDVPAVVGGGSPGVGSQVITLRYASAKQLATMLSTYAGEGAKITADPARNVLVVSGSATARQNIIDLVRVFDVDYLAGQSYALFPATSGDPTKLAADLQAALQLESDGALSGVVKVVPIDEANAVMVITRQAAYLDRVTRLMEQLSQTKVNAGRNIHVYYLKNTQPGDLQPLLQRAVNPPSNSGASQEDSGPGNVPPGTVTAQVTASSAVPGAMASAMPSLGVPAGMDPTQQAQAMQGQGAPQQQPATSDSAAAKPKNGPGVAGSDAKGPQIIADNGNSALIVVSTDSEYSVIEAAIRKLDVLPQQVLVEATIAEVSLNNALQYGVQFFLQNSEGQINLSNAQSPSPVTINPAAPITSASLFPGLMTSNFPGLAIARTAGDVQVALQALKNITNVQVISAPKLLIMDKEQATFQVGDLVPIITQSATSVITAGAPVVNNVQYQATGVILTVTPRINSGGLVTLDIEQEVSDVVPTTTSSINSPTFQQRRIKTKVIVQNGETISLAGLISDKKTKGNSGVPLLQDIPVLGTLFSTKTNDSDRTELLVLLTPHVISNQQDARVLTEELRRKLSPSAILP